MLSIDQVRNVIGGQAYGQDGGKLGKVGQVFLDDETGQPEWATVNTGLFGTSESFVPLAQATVEGDDLRLPYGKDDVKGAPKVEAAQGHLSEAEEIELYRYYGLDYTQATSDSGLPTGTTGTETGAVGHDTSGPTTDSAMTRSEERVRVGTERVQTGRVRLRKYIVSEHVTQAVPVERETVRVEREPITDANYDRALSGPDLSEEEHEVVLTEQRPVVAKETVPVERVRLDKDVVVEQETVDTTVRKEQIEVLDETGPARGTTSR